MSLFGRDQFVEEEHEAGIHMDRLGTALVTWAAMNYGKKQTVAEAAEAFNTTADVIREAIGCAMWITYVGPDDDPTKQTIELDGE